MTRLGILALTAAALSACAGLPPTTHPLLIARPADSTAPAPASPTVSIEMNSLVLVLPASTVSGCFDLVGDYVRKGSEVDVHLRQADPAASCDGPRQPFITRIGPLPPGNYDVTVTLDGRTLIRAQSAAIS